ncbi:MAG TPA: hypothetical protein DCX89_06130 [Saprospirales bacterium]|nr:hypothetical protein [Saprospirales bacterium]
MNIQWKFIIQGTVNLFIQSPCLLDNYFLFTLAFVEKCNWFILTNGLYIFLVLIVKAGYFFIFLDYSTLIMLIFAR